MDRFVARVNIVHIRDMLASEQNEVKRQTLLRILADEEARLAALENKQSKKERQADLAC
jgi:bacterioferritin (cytochrome b1)